MAGTFTDTWNTAYEGIPSDNENINLGANRIRDLKVAVHQRLAINHSWNGDSSDGKHTICELTPQTNDPVLDPGDGAIYQKAVSGNQELFYEDNAARVTQITNQGALSVTPPFPSGTVMLFVQNAAPPGWVQGRNINDAVLRIVNDNSGSGTGGSWGISGLNASTSVLGHQLSSAELPSHTHQVNAMTAVGGNLGFQSGATYELGQFSITTDGGAVGNAAHSHGASTSVSGDGTWRPAYLNAIFCFKQ